MVAKYEWLMWPFVILVFSVTCFALYNLLVHLMLTWLAVEQISGSNSKSIDMNFDHKQLRPVIYMYFAKKKSLPSHCHDMQLTYSDVVE